MAGKMAKTPFFCQTSSGEQGFKSFLPAFLWKIDISPTHLTTKRWQEQFKTPFPRRNLASLSWMAGDSAKGGWPQKKICHICQVPICHPVLVVVVVVVIVA